MSDIAISVENVSKTFVLPHEKQDSIKGIFLNILRRNRTFEKQEALKNVSFTIKKGEFFGIVGRNGSGKSTMLKLLAGIYTPDRGVIHVKGNLTPFIELGVGFNPELTGRENVFLNGSLLGFSRKEIYKMYDEIVKFAELEKFMDQKLKNYSSGMQVRLAFSIAIKANTEVMLFDEVLAVGDAKFQKKCLQVFRDLKQAGKTIILVSHNTADMERFCDRILVLERGESLGIFTAREGSALYQELNFEDNDPKTSKENKVEKRWGTGLVEIEKIVAVSKEDKYIKTGKPLDIEVTLKRRKTDSELGIKLGIAFYDAEGTNISGPNSYAQKITFLSGEKSIKVAYRIKKNVLNKGSYKITAAVVSEDESEVYDHRIDILNFNVINDTEYFGKVLLDGNWQKI